MGVTAGLIGTTLVCLSNISIMVFVLSGRIEGAYGVLYKGSCERTRSLNVWIHLVVNALSTLLLGASNYCMQVLSAPTRDELVRAHTAQDWLHIGIPSFRNLRYIAKNRAYIWSALLLSSVPLHLFFNSVAVTTLQANEYLVIPTTEEWMHGAAYNTSGLNHTSPYVNVTEIVANMTSLSLNTTSRPDWYTVDGLSEAKYRNVSAKHCFDAYNDQYVSSLGNVYIVQDGATILGSGDIPELSMPDEYPSGKWRCHTSDVCNDGYQNFTRNATYWQPYYRPVQYCLIEEVPERCSLILSIPIAILVIISNMIKAICMGWMLRRYRRHLPLVTLGDVIAHFLDNPDPQTKGRCLLSRRAVEAQWTYERFNGTKSDEVGLVPQEYRPKRRRWRTASSGRRWFFTYLS